MSAARMQLHNAKEIVLGKDFDTKYTNKERAIRTVLHGNANTHERHSKYMAEKKAMDSKVVSSVNFGSY